MTSFDSPDGLATFLVGMGYDQAAVVETVRKEYPDLEDPHAVVERASQVVRQEHAALDALADAEVQQAVDAEHDLSKSMHEEEPK